MRVFTTLLMAIPKLHALFKELPCLVSKALPKAVRGYKVYGNSEQEEIPSISYPADVNGVGILVTDTSDPYYGKYKIPVIATQGDNTTTTNIYSVVPLHKMGDAIDSINYATQKITMATAYYDFTGSETFDSVHNTFGYAYICTNILPNSSATSDSDVLCTHFKSSGSLYDIRFNLTENGSKINFRVSNQWTSKTDFKNWLATQYSLGTPVRIYYPLTNPIVIDPRMFTGGVAFPSITPFRGDSVYTINTPVQPYSDENISGFEIDAYVSEISQ